MKRISMKLSILLLAISLTACGVGNVPQVIPPPAVPSPSTTQDAAEPSEEAVAPPKQEGSITKPVPPPPPVPPAQPTPTVPPATEEVIRSMQIAIGNKNFSATLAENDAVNAFIELMKTAPVVINMSDYSGFEKVGSLGTSLPTSNSSITANAGDIVLYNGNQIVVFYGSNSWSYTRLGKIDDLSELKDALGDGDVTITFSIN